MIHLNVYWWIVGWQSALLFPIQTERIGQGVHHTTALWRGPSWLLAGGSLRPVNLRLSLKQAKAGRKEKEVSAKSTGEKGVQEGVGAGVDGVKQDQQEFGVWHRDERMLQGSRDGEEGDGSHAEEVCEDEDGHALSHAGVGVSRRWWGLAVGQVDA